MAKQVGPLFFTGTVDGIIFYKLGDNYYMRSKGSYKSGKQMRKDRTYTRTMQQADRFGAASNLLKEVYYRYLPKAVRKHGLYGKLTGMINKWLYAGKSVEEVRELLLAHCQQLATSVKPAAPVVKEQATRPSNNAQPATTDAPSPLPNYQLSSVHCTLSPKNEQRSTSNVPPPLYNEQPSTPTVHRPKHPRYLSRWKVKRNGRLYIPGTADQPLVASYSTHRQPNGTNRQRHSQKDSLCLLPTSS